MQIQPYYGVRNVPVFTANIRSDLGFSLETLAKYLDLSSLELLNIELGNILPHKKSLDRLRTLKRWLPVLDTTLTISISFRAFFARFFTRFMGQWEEISGKSQNGQLILDCCISSNYRTIPISLLKGAFKGLILSILLIPIVMFFNY